MSNENENEISDTEFKEIVKGVGDLMTDIATDVQHIASTLNKIKDRVPAVTMPAVKSGLIQYFCMAIGVEVENKFDEDE